MLRIVSIIVVTIFLLRQLVSEQVRPKLVQSSPVYGIWAQLLLPSTSQPKNLQYHSESHVPNSQPSNGHIWWYRLIRPAITSSPLESSQDCIPMEITQRPCVNLKVWTYWPWRAKTKQASAEVSTSYITHLALPWAVGDNCLGSILWETSMKMKKGSHLLIEGNLLHVWQVGCTDVSLPCTNWCGATLWQVSNESTSKCSKSVKLSLKALNTAGWVCVSDIQNRPVDWASSLCKSSREVFKMTWGGSVPKAWYTRLRAEAGAWVWCHANRRLELTVLETIWD